MILVVARMSGSVLLLLCLLLEVSRASVPSPPGSRESSLLPQMKAAKKSKPRPADVIETFYRSYLNPSRINSKAKPDLVRSKGFEKLIRENQRICEKFAAGDICGWGADGDVYLDSQEWELEGFEKSGTVIKDLGGGRVEVRFNVFPALKDPRYDRWLVFQMLWESKRWVVDDIHGANGSARKTIQEEIDFYLPKLKN